MNQMDLFELESTGTEARETESVTIRSGRVGPVHFGSTTDSFALTRDVLTALVAPTDEEKVSS